MRELKFYIPKVKTRRQGKILLLSFVVTLIIITLLALGIKVEEPKREPPQERAPLNLTIVK
jgi:hypothetical protein